MATAGKPETQSVAKDAARSRPRNVLFSADEAGRHMLDGTIRVLLAEGLLLPAGLAIAAFLTRWLGPGGYGLYTLAAAIVWWVESCVTSIFSRATVKLVGTAQDWKQWGTTVVQVHLLISMFAAGVLCLLSSPLAALLNEPRLAGYLRLFALDIPIFSLGQTHRDILVALGSSRKRALTSAARWISKLALVIVLVQLGLSVRGAILGNIGVSLFDLLVGRFYARPPLLARANVQVRRLWDYGMPMFLFAVGLRFYESLWSCPLF